jgi:hypothetical protein
MGSCDITGRPSWPAYPSYEYRCRWSSSAHRPTEPDLKLVTDRVTGRSNRNKVQDEPYPFEPGVEPHLSSTSVQNTQRSWPPAAGRRAAPPEEQQSRRQWNELCAPSSPSQFPYVQNHAAAPLLLRRRRPIRCAWRSSREATFGTGEARREEEISPSSRRVGVDLASPAGESGAVGGPCQRRADRRPGTITVQPSLGVHKL